MQSLKAALYAQFTCIQQRGGQGQSRLTNESKHLSAEPIRKFVEKGADIAQEFADGLEDGLLAPTVGAILLSTSSGPD